MRVVVFHPGAELYGSDRMVLETLRAHVSSGYDVTFVVPNDGKLVELARQTGARVVVHFVPAVRKSLLKPGRAIQFALSSLARLFSQVRLIKNEAPDAVWVNTIIQPSWLMAARLAGVPSIVHVRESEDQAHPLLQYLILSPLGLARRVVANSASTAQWVDERRASKTTPKSEVVYNAKNWDSYYRSDVEFLPATLQLLLVGRLSPRKGQDLALEALSALSWNGNVILNLVGDPFEGYEWFEQELRERAAMLPPSRKVVFTGFLSDPSEALERAHIVLVPSRVEPFGTVAAEAMAAKRPVIVSGIGGLQEIVTDGEDGLVSSPGDSSHLASRIDAYCQDPTWAASVAERGYLSVRRRFDLAAYHRAVVDITQTTVAGENR